MRLKLTVMVVALLVLVVASTADVSAKLPPREQFMPSLAYNSHPEVRNFTLVWVEDRGTGRNIYAKRLFYNGLPQGGAAKNGWQVIRDQSAYRRNVPPPGPRSDPALIYNSAQEEYMMVYSEHTGEGDGWDVFSVRVSAAGYAIGNPRMLAGGPGDQQHPDVGIINDRESRTNEYLVVWDDNTRDVDEVWAVRLRVNGIPKGRAYAIVQNQYNASDPTTNGTQVAWVDDRDGQTDIWSIKLKNGLPSGTESALSSEIEDEFNPRYGSSGLTWNIFDPSTGIDIMGVQILENARVRGTQNPILVPAADQNWPTLTNNVLVFADNRSGEYDLYAIRILGGARLRARGKDYPVMSDR